MLIHHAIFHCELFLWFIFFTEYTINFVDVGRSTLDNHLPAVSPSVERLDTAGHINFLKSFIPSTFNSLSIVQKHVAQTCSSITLADSRTFINVCLQR